MPRPKSYQTAATAGADAADPFSSSDDDAQKDDEEAVLERLARPPPSDDDDEEYDDDDAPPPDLDSDDDAADANKENVRNFQNAMLAAAPDAHLVPKPKAQRKRRRQKPEATEPAQGARVLCVLEASLRGKSGLALRYGGRLEGKWAYRREHLDTAHALRVDMNVLEREPGTFACSGTFLDDPVLWGERKVRDDAFVVEVGSDGRTVTGSGESFYGRYDVEGTLDRTGGQTYAKLRLHKLKKLKPWYYEHCYVCGSDEKSDGDLLLCDGQDGRSPASPFVLNRRVDLHAIDATPARSEERPPRTGACKKACHVKCDGLRSVPAEDWYCVDCRALQCGPSCICRTKKRRA